MTYSPEPSGFLSERSGAHAPWRWQLLDAQGSEVAADKTGPGTVRFSSQGDAETWIGEVWQQLLEDGVESVTLFEADRQVYGPMSLRPA